MPRKYSPPYGVAADAERARRGDDGAGMRLAGDLGAIDVEPQGGTVVRRGKVTPGVERQSRRARQVAVAVGRRPGIEIDHRATGGRGRIQRVNEATRLLLHQYGLQAGGGSREPPGLESYTG